MLNSWGWLCRPFAFAVQRIEDLPCQMEASMRYVLQLSILIAAFDISTARALDRIRLAQAVPGQIVTPGLVQPVPLTPTPLISSQISTACLVACDTQVMNCQNACVEVGPTTGTLNPAGSAPCTLNCTTQQLVCKQTCTRPLQ
jgi:hypothetical protein